MSKGATVKITGMDVFVFALAKKSRATQKAFRNSAVRGGLRIQREAQKRVPVDTGNLRASAATRTAKDSRGTRVDVGFTASYALFVHENTDMKLKGMPRGEAEPGKGYRGHYWDPQPQAGPKFLENPARELEGSIISDLRRSVRAAMARKV